MTCYLHKKFGVVYVQVHKTGSTSIKRGMLGEADDFRSGAIQADWRDCYRSFAVIRHPYERMRSVIDHFKYQRKIKSQKELDAKNSINAHAVIDVLFDDSIAIGRRDYFERLKKHCLPLTHEYYSIHLVDQIFRSDDFAVMWRDLAKWLNVKPPRLMHKKRARHRTELSRAEKRAVRSAYAEDFERYGYQD